MRPEIRQEWDSPERETFIRDLREALAHLHSSDHLRRNPLAAAFGVAGRFDTALELRRILNDAITALKPADDEADPARAWRAHDSLYCCYVQQLSQQAVADQIGVSVRQLRREQRAALEILADHLWTRIRAITPDEATLHELAEAGDGIPSLNDELAWLRELPPEKPTDLNHELPDVLSLARRLAGQHEVQLSSAVPSRLPDLAVHPVALRELLLNVLSAAIVYAAGSEVTVTAQDAGWAVEMVVQAGLTGRPEMDADASLGMAREIARLSRCRLDVSLHADRLTARLALPAIEQVPVLVVDDNPDTLQLLQRYTSGTPYHLTGIDDPEQAVRIAEETAPELIVLDVMMPQVDGWKVLGRLRENPATREIPVVVCTVVPQEALAHALGASGFIRKPVTRQAFLAALDQQLGTGARESN